MSVKNQFESYGPEDDEEFGYYYPPLFRYPCGCSDDTRQQPDTTDMNTGTSTGFTGEAGVLSPEYLQGYIRRFIGKSVRAQFLVGETMLQDRTGVLTEVGASYLVLRSPETGVLVVCDVYSLRFLDVLS
jgi:hypothetical protein